MTPEQIAQLPYRQNVGIVLRKSDGRVFAGKRLERFEQYKFAWQMPQGGIDDGEIPKDAALREMYEETGVCGDSVHLAGETLDWINYDLPADILPQIWGGRYRGQTQKWYLFDFIGDDSAIDINTDKPEFSQWRWMSPSDIMSAIVPFKRATYQQVFREFAML